MDGRTDGWTGGGSSEGDDGRGDGTRRAMGRAELESLGHPLDMNQEFTVHARQLGRDCPRSPSLEARSSCPAIRPTPYQLLEEATSLSTYPPTNYLPTSKLELT